MCIHPFEDGNGRIGRALAEKSLAQNLSQPSLIALAYTIERKRKDYYASLERNNKELEITWLTYSPSTILEAQRNTITRVDFFVAKAKFYETFTTSSTSAKTVSSPACSRRASTASRAACQQTTTSPSARLHAPPRPETCKT